MNSVGGYSTSIIVTPTITAFSSYNPDTQLGGVQTISQAALAEGRVTTLVSLTIVDKAMQSPNL